MSTQTSVQYWIYPLAEGSGFTFSPGNRPITPTNYWAGALQGDTDEWRLSTGFHLIKPWDWVWAYFGGGIRQVLGVGTVVSALDWNPAWGEHSVHIRWNKRLTARLKADPIGYDDYGQHVQRAAVRATQTTRQVFDDWLARYGRPSSHPSAQVQFVQREINQRLGQQAFRAEVLRTYGRRCAISGCTEPNVLQAAHVASVATGGLHAVENSLLLRADLHNLFDLGLLTIGPHFRVQVSPIVTERIYRQFHGRTLTVPTGVKRSALSKAFAAHREQHGSL